MPELLDIVNEHDEIIGQKALSDILRHDHIIRVSHVWIINEQKQFLIHCLPNDNHIDASAGGRVKLGETYEDVAQRKFTDICLQCGELIRGEKYFADMPGLRIFVQAFLAHADGELMLDPNTCHWLSLADLEAKIKRQPQLFVPNILQSLNAVKGLL